MRGIRGFAFSVFIIFLFSFVSASFSVGNLSDGIETSYGPGMNIIGWINISLSNEESTSLLESSLGGSIRLIDLIKKTPSNSGFIYNCQPATCESNYLANGLDTSKTFNLGSDETALFGMQITANKNVGGISEFHLDLSSNNPQTETMPLAIDILNDGQIEWQAYAASEEFGSEDFGCFVGINPTTQLIANTPQYCEKISLPKTPGVELGAYVTYEKGTGSVNFEMSIENSDGTGSKKVCTATTTGSGIKRLSCIPTDFSAKEEGDYYVCIKTKLAADNGKYKINSEQTNPCGFTGTYDGSYNYDFEVFARAQEYAPAISIALDDAELARADSPILNVENYIDEYITENYANNCSRGCVIPIKVYSGIEQEIGVSNFFMSYIADTYTENTNVYDVEETPAEISSSYQKLFLDDANFSVPSSFGNHTFSLDLKEANVLTKKISVGEVAQIKSITPTRTAVKYPTTFTAEATGKNITGYSWNFGDGATEITSTNFVSHTYNSIGTYTLRITVNSMKGSSSKNFNITVGPASEIVPSLLDDAESSINNIRTQMTGFSQFEQDSIDSTLGLSSAETTIGDLNDAVLTAVSESDYEAILAELLIINLPIGIAKTATSEGLIFFPSTANIDLDALKEIGGGDYTAGKEDQYREAVISWYNTYVGNDLSYSEISLIYSDREEPLRIFEMQVTKSGTDSAYFIIKEMEKIFIENQADYSEVTGYFYTDLNGGKNIRFSTTEEVDFVNVPVFISPSLSNLRILEITPPEPINWALPIIIIVAILLIAGIIWIVLQFWYTRKYESYLFKDRNQLYNLVNYISDAKKKGESNDNISDKLKKTGWNAEQVRYALRKYEQKNTGLPEIIPIKKILEGLKKIPSVKNKK